MKDVFNSVKFLTVNFKKNVNTVNKQLQTDHISAFVLDPVKIFLTPSVIMQHLFVVFHTVYVHEGSFPKKFGDGGTQILWDGVWQNPRNMLLPHVLPYQI